MPLTVFFDLDDTLLNTNLDTSLQEMVAFNAKHDQIHLRQSTALSNI